MQAFFLQKLFLLKCSRGKKDIKKKSTANFFNLYEKVFILVCIGKEKMSFLQKKTNQKPPPKPCKNPKPTDSIFISSWCFLVLFPFPLLFHHSLTKIVNKSILGMPEVLSMLLMGIRDIRYLCSHETWDTAGCQLPGK